MYDAELSIVKESMPKFNVIQNHIVVFIRKYRLRDAGVENKKCCIGVHDMKIGQTAYVFNGEPFNLKNSFCSDMKCFLNNLDSDTITKTRNQ